MSLVGPAQSGCGQARACSRAGEPRRGRGQAAAAPFTPMKPPGASEREDTAPPANRRGRTECPQPWPTALGAAGGLRDTKGVMRAADPTLQWRSKASKGWVLLGHQRFASWHVPRCPLETGASRSALTRALVSDRAKGSPSSRSRDCVL